MDAASHSAPLVLYVRTGCRHCAKVLSVAEELGITFELKNIQDWDTHEELEAVGGKVQVPYLIDAAHNVALYEADDIVDHLHRTYGNGTVQRKEHTNDNDSCNV